MDLQALQQMWLFASKNKIEFAIGKFVDDYFDFQFGVRLFQIVVPTLLYERDYQVEDTLSDRKNEQMSAGRNISGKGATDASAMQIIEPRST